MKNLTNQIVTIAQKAGEMFNGAGGCYREQTEIGEVEASATSVHCGAHNRTYRTTYMLNKKRISYANLMKAVRAAE